MLTSSFPSIRPPRSLDDAEAQGIPPTSDNVTKALKCEGAYHDAFMRLLASAIVRTRSPAEGQAWHAGVENGKRSKELRLLLQVVVPTLSETWLTDAAMMLVRSNCVVGLKALFRCMRNFDDLGEAGCLKNLASKGAMHLACLLRHESMIRFFLTAVYDSDFFCYPIILGGRGLTPEDRTYDLTPLHCVLAGPSSHVSPPPAVAATPSTYRALAEAHTPARKSVAACEEPLLGDAAEPSPLGAILPALQLLVRHPDTGRKSHVDMTALLSSAKEAQLRPNWTRMPPCASGAHSADQRKVTWLTLLKRPAQPKAAEACALLQQYSTFDAAPVYAQLRREAAEASLRGALQSDSPEAVRAWHAEGASGCIVWSSLEPDTKSLIEGQCLCASSPCLPLTSPKRANARPCAPLCGTAPPPVCLLPAGF